MTAPADVIAIAEREVSYVETGGPHGNDGNYTKFGQWYGLNPAPWCAEFVSWCFFMAGLPLRATTDKGFAYCPSGEAWAKNMGLWVATGSGGFQVGDVAIYGTSIGVHTGIICGPFSARGFDAIEGNTDANGATDGGRVMVRTRDIGWVRGVIRPPWTSAPPAPVPGAPAWPGRNLALTTPHMRGEDVRAVQRKVIAFGSNLTPWGGADGDYGQATKDAVTWWQHAFGLVPDGVVGAATWHTFFSR